MLLTFGNVPSPPKAPTKSLAGQQTAVQQQPQFFGYHLGNFPFPLIPRLCKLFLNILRVFQINIHNLFLNDYFNVHLLGFISGKIT
jgi:hypothetical protein